MIILILCCCSIGSWTLTLTLTLTLIGYLPSVWLSSCTWYVACLLPISSVTFWTWKCCFRRLTGWLSKCYLRQRHQYCLMWLSVRGETWVGFNGSHWSSVLGFENLMGHTWEAWFRILTWWFPKVCHLQCHFIGRKFEYDRIYGQHFKGACQV